MSSLKARLLIALTIVLMLFFGVTGVTLERAFTNSAKGSLYDRLEGYAGVLIALSEQSEEGVARLIDVLPEERFNYSNSGLYARFVSNDGQYGWYSASMAGRDIPFRSGLASGNSSFERIEMQESDDAEDVYAFSIGVTWGVDTDDELDNATGYTFSIAEASADVDERIANFRRILWGWLGTVSLILLAVQGSVLHWSLVPLRRAEKDLDAIKSGSKASLSGAYPKELLGLTENINSLIHSNHERLLRYRNTLDNLAHSLKTPLALMRSTIESNTAIDDKTTKIFDEQIERMRSIIDSQLRRAATSGGESITVPIAISSIASKILLALEKVHAEKHVSTRLLDTHKAKIRMDESDLYELLGNLLDNAFKWCHKRVEVSIHVSEPGEVVIVIEDDGQGIAEDMVDQVLRRGARADTSTPGQGIGLSAAAEIINIYKGVMTIGRSRLQGAAITLRLPQH
ncbi:MAG: GHKL domain-containing protein [Gammaproteobacteria bacterium]|nr:GHKL domain-containing protein [Gammaproteobacteria bacterium]